MIPGLGEMAYEGHWKRLKLSTLSYYHLRGDIIETYKIIYGGYDRDVTTGLFNLTKDSHSIKKPQINQSEKTAGAEGSGIRSSRRSPILRSGNTLPPPK